MCGISGIATTGGLRDGDPSLLDGMLRALAHRGPDDQHVHGDGRTLLGARRLAIIDLDSGRQPLVDETGDIVASQNGEIYNYLELRAELEAKGHRFRTQGDTETLVHLYQEHGPDFPRFLRGMYAIAVWDGRLGRLVLARDRLGKKPLYWRLDAGRLSYGSELKALLVAPDVPRVIDRRALALYLQHDYVPAPWTIFEGIAKLPPATVLTWDGGEPRVETYWRPTYGPKASRTFQEDMEEGASILQESVRLRLRSDVPLGVFLSGGMDSSVVTALMAEASSEPVRTFSIGFDDPDVDESAYARAVARHFGTVHTEETVRIDAVGMLPDLAYHFDEPLADPSALPTMRVSKLAGASLKVVLTGDGGDESFGGYIRYLSQLGQGGGPLLASAKRAMRWVPGGVIRTVARSGQAVLPVGSAPSFRQRLEAAERLAGLNADERYANLMTTIGRADRARLLGSMDAARGSEAYLLGILAAGPTQPLDRVLHCDMLGYLAENLLVKMDRASMAASLEARSPLLDHRLVEFAALLPADRKIAGATTKVLLRSIAKTLMPEALIERPKRGFGLPLGSWFRGELGDVFRDLVLAPGAVAADHLDLGVAHRLLDDHQARIAENGPQLWSLLTFEVWARRWLSGSDTARVAPASIPVTVA